MKISERLDDAYPRNRVHKICKKKKNDNREKETLQ